MSEGVEIGYIDVGAKILHVEVRDDGWLVCTVETRVPWHRRLLLLRHRVLIRLA